MKTQSRKSTRWWIIFLFIPLLVSCQVVPALVWQLTIIVGEAIAYTAVGYTIEQAIDQWLHHDVGYTIPDSNNPLYGTYSTTMKLENKETRKTYTVSHPRMYRVSLDSEWELAPDLKELVEQVLR